MRLLRTLQLTSVGDLSHLYHMNILPWIILSDVPKVSTATQTYFQNILGDTTTDYLASVATYVGSSLHPYEKSLTKYQADTYRYTSAGLYSQPYHFIDANDDPPSSCGVEYNRDCGSKGCVVSAIKNYVSSLDPYADPCLRPSTDYSCSKQHSELSKRCTSCQGKYFFPI